MTASLEAAPFEPASDKMVMGDWEKGILLNSAESRIEKPLMFAPLYPEVSKRWTGLVSASLILHFVFLGWLLHSPAPIFVAQSSVVKGQSGSLVTRIYFGGDSGVAQEKPKPRVSWQRPQKKNAARVLPPPRAEVGDGE